MALECAVAAIIQDWINTVLQGICLLVFIVVLCRRHSETARNVLYHVYGVVLVLNIVEGIAFAVVYLVLFDVILELCEEYEVEPPKDERLQFASVDTCVYNLRMVTFGAAGALALLYLSLKIYFTRVLFSYYLDLAQFNRRT